MQKASNQTLESTNLAHLHHLSPSPSINPSLLLIENQMNIRLPLLSILMHHRLYSPGSLKRQISSYPDFQPHLRKKIKGLLYQVPVSLI